MKISVLTDGHTKSFTIDEKCTVSVLGNFIVFKDYCGKEVVVYHKDAVISIFA